MDGQGWKMLPPPPLFFLPEKFGYWVEEAQIKNWGAKGGRGVCISRTGSNQCNLCPVSNLTP
jgi:hypothetical protein